MIKLSVCIITFNHENFIRTAIEGALMQKTNFPFEVIIGEDFSADNTRNICLEYKNNNPNIIKLYLREKNIGMMNNFIETLKECKGKYIALCEGDDYWTDPYKLQKQVDILEANQYLVGCFHNSEERYWNDYSKASSLYLSFDSGQEVSIKNITSYNMIPTASVVFKTPIQIELFSEKFLKLPVGDWPIHLLNTRNGNYYYLPQVMSVRNLYPSSVWGMQNQNNNVNKVITAYDLLIESNWFKKEICDLLIKGRDDLKNATKHKKNDLSLFKYKKKLINKVISLLNKL
jgi:glycosyltransferase involved in cell wall biosynthesis